MASITSLSNSSYNTSSIYGSRNVLSGLASGMDTEQMIENAVSGIKLKIQNLQKKRTKVEWQQEAYRSIIDKAVNLNQKYTSYSSKTNLMSSSFFSNAVNTTASGTFKDKVSASGKTTSDIRINAVKQLATAASYTVSGLGGKFSGELTSVTGGEAFDITGELDLSAMSGSLTFQYGGTNGASFNISFDELENLNEVEVLNADGTVKEDATNAEKLAQAINNKLGEITYSYTKNGFQESTTADKAVKVTANADGRITFSDGLGNGNSVKISSSSGNMEKFAGENVLVVPKDLTEKVSTVEYLGGKQRTDGKWSGGKELGITFNGTTKKISMSDVLNRVNENYEANTAAGKDKQTQFNEALQAELDDAFGAGKITVGHEDGKLSFAPKGKGDTLALGGSALDALGFESGDTNYINAGKKLKDLVGEDLFKPENRLKAVGSVNTERLTDEAGNKVALGEDGETYYRVDSDGKFRYDFKINGASISVNEDTTLESLMNSINSNAEAGVKVSYSKLTNEFKFTANETGANSRIEFEGLAKDLFATHDRSASDNFSKTYDLGLGEGETRRFAFKIDGVGGTYSFGIKDTDTIQDITDRLNSLLNTNHHMTASFDELSGQLKITDDKTGKAADFKLLSGDGDLSKPGVFEYDLPKFESSYTSGQDAVMDVEVNGKRFENLTRASNTFDIDGLNITAKGTFNVDGKNAPDKDGNEYEAVTFTTTTDSDKIVDAIKEFVNDYNAMATELKSAYSTMPAQKSNGARYEPLTAEEEDKYSESELKAYNEKAKQGILFGDSNLSSMYSKLLGAITPGGTDGQTLREIGIGTSYSDGMTTLSLDEDKLRAALESDPDKVRNAFTKTREGGSASDGLMKTLQNTLDTYVRTTGEPKGVLITRAGSVKAPTSLNSNSLKSQMDSIDKQIDRWTDKMSDQIDRYTSKFSKLEQLIAEMNSQSSALMGLMGGGSSY